MKKVKLGDEIEKLIMCYQIKMFGNEKNKRKIETEIKIIVSKLNELTKPQEKKI